MKKSVFLLFFTTLFLHAQQKKVYVHSDRDENNGNVTIYADNNTKSSYTVMINFITLKNTNHSFSNPYLITVEPGRNTVLILNKSNSGSSVQYRYKYNYRKGCLKTLPDRDIVYMIPASENKDILIRHLKSFNNVSDMKTPEKGKNTGYIFRGIDTVFAARRGKVVRLTKAEGRNKAHLKRGSIELEHNDCTFGMYTEIDHLFVQEGDVVFPGQALGIVMERNDMTFKVYYPEIKVSIDGKLSSENKYIPVLFDVDGKSTELKEGEKYHSSHRFEIISQEMRKKEIRKYKKLHKI